MVGRVDRVPTEELFGIVYKVPVLRVKPNRSRRGSL